MPNTKTPKPPSKAALKRAAKLLQAAHDQIEAVGFDIDRYGFTSEVQDGQIKAPMCYIGSMRAIAGINPDPASGGNDRNDAGAGDGPELILALQAMDKIARRRLKSGVAELKKDYPVTTGRFVERLGFQVQERAADKFPLPIHPGYTSTFALNKWDAEFDRIAALRKEYEKAYALKLLRQALTEIYA